MVLVKSTEPANPAKTTRRQAILDAALECFSTLGYDQTTLADIRSRAGASIGSIYHHFSSKEQLAGALYLEAVAETQDAGLRALLKTRSGKAGIAALVRSYLDYVEANPAKAAFLLDERHAAFMADREAVLDELNDDARRASQRWFDERVAAGELPQVDPVIRRSLIFGPCRYFARRWLSGDAPVPMRTAKRQLAAATHAGLVALATDGRSRSAS